jgi:hypothetical protein
MKKFNYQIAIEAPSKEIADFIMKLISNENEGLITGIRAEKTPEEKEEERKLKEAVERKEAIEAIGIFGELLGAVKERMIREFNLDFPDKKENTQSQKTETKQ